MRLVLHIGAAKTGTTSIQHALYRNRDVLREYGVYLPAAGQFEFASQSVAHHHLSWEVVEPRRFNPEAGGWDALTKELAEEDPPIALVSAEALERLTYTDERRAALEERLARITDDVTVVYVVREQLSQLNSLYTQNVKSLRMVEEFKAWIRRVVRSERFDLDKCFEPWYDSDRLNLVAVPFDEMLERDLLVSLLDRASIDVPADRLDLPEGRSNESVSPVAVEAARLLGLCLRSVDPSYNHRTSAGQRLYRMASAAARRRGWDDSKYWGWTPRFATRMAAEFTASNERFAQAVWSSPWPLEPPIDRPTNAATLLELPPAQLREVLDHVTELTMAYRELTPEATVDEPPPDDTDEALPEGLMTP